MASSKSTPASRRPIGKKTPAGKKSTALKNKASSHVSSAADAVDEQLARYRSMRDFAATAEPSGDHSRQDAKALPFCVQKHEASHLHYDFRLGWNGVLKSWAIAKGPSYFTGDKRLAVQVEDHPLEYGGFEGIIPKGQYGGGTVMLWDQGTWEPQAQYPDVEAGLRDGSLKFILHGTKLKGKWALIRMKGKWAKESKPNWLLIKEHDEFEQAEDEEPITEAEQRSVITGRSMAEIAHSEDHVWSSNKTKSEENAWVRKPARAEAELNLQQWLKGLATEKQPQFVPPEQATMADVPPSSSGWLHELKLDGYRIQARKSNGNVRMLTRTGLDWAARMRAVADEIARIPVSEITLDGELVVVAPNGTTSFADLQASMQEGAKRPLTYFAFDLLHLDSKDTRGLPLATRKKILAEILNTVDGDTVRFSEHIEKGGETLLREACKLQAEGIVSKKADSTYRSGRTTDWIKTKCLHEQEFIVGGFTLPTNGIHGVGALLLGYYRDSTLIYAGRTGTGFTQKTHQLLRDKLEDLRSQRNPFESVPEEAKKGAYWIKPELVVQVRFATWTADNLVRHAAFLGIREDKVASEVTREDISTSLGPRGSRTQRTSARKSNEVTTMNGTAAHKTEPEMHAPVRLTHPDKVLDKDSGLTKQMLADYYWQISKYMLAEIANRPVSLVRCPDGVGTTSFFQKHRNTTLPRSVGSVDVPDKKTGKIEQYITVSSAEALAELAQIGVLEVHPWGSQNDDLEHPDRLIFDLDPDEALGWEEVAEAAKTVRDRLQKAGLKSFVKTTGGKGLHIVAPIRPTLSWVELKEFAHSFVSSIEKDSPNQYLTKMTKSARTGKIYLDYLRNERGATSVAAYSPRARAGVPVSLPLSWQELLASRARLEFRVANFQEWKKRLNKNPWKELYSLEQTIHA